MRRTNDNNRPQGYVGPISAMLGLGVPALTLNRFDNLLLDAGMGRSTISKDTLNAIKRYIGIQPNSVSDIRTFFPEYVSRARDASGARIFGPKSDLTVAEMFNDSPYIRAPKKLSHSSSILLSPIKPRLGSIGPTSNAYLAAEDQIARETAAVNAAVGRVANTPEDIQIKANDIARHRGALESARLSKSLATHILGTSGSYEDAYLRLLNETAGAYAVGKDIPILRQARSSAKGMAEDLYEAVINHTRPTRAGFSSPFSSASEYLDAIWGSAKGEGAFRKLPGAYRSALDIAESTIHNSSTREEAIAKLTNMISGGGPDRKFYSTLREKLGKPDNFSLTDTANGKVFKRIFGSGKHPGIIKSKEDAILKGSTDLATAIFHGDAARVFSNAASHHINNLRQAKMFNVIQRIRNPYLRAALGLGTAGGMGVLIDRIIDNNKPRPQPPVWVPDFLKKYTPEWLKS